MLKPSLIFLVIFVLVSVAGFAQSGHGEKQAHKKNEHTEQEEDLNEALNHAGDENGHGEASHHAPPGWTVIPFIMLLLMIATGPLFYEHFWHKNYPIIAIALATMVVLYYLFVLHNNHGPVHALAEYVQFISLLTGLFVASGGVLISVDKEARPLTNAGILLIGAVIANVIGTTGASMLLIRPYIRLNRYRIKPYHIIFFIFLVSNIGGCLTPIGDPPLFLGFLKGIPFFWTMKHNVIPWLFALIVLLIMFVFFDKNNKADYSYGDEKEEPTNKISISGIKNFFWLGVVVLSVFLDPNVFDWVPAIYYDGQKFSFMREIIMLTAAYLSFKFADKKALEGNDFSFEPIREVAFIFIGIFGTMMPALELVSNFAQSDEGSQLISQNTLYWGTGFLSGFLDNAPTYVNFLTAALASDGGDINSYKDVLAYARGGFSNSIIELKAISVSAVFFGAMTYIGNGPNFMVKSIAEQVGIKMPSFFGYIIRFSIPLLIPLFIIVWLIFFAFKPVG
ncbi:MAG TPA: sodium:proton antiporter [Cyclobacteriaceae bacterium]